MTGTDATATMRQMTPATGPSDPGDPATDEWDAATRATRLAANLALGAVAAWGLLFLVTAQIRWVREASPFRYDPWDIIVSYAAIFLPVVVGTTFVRSVRHRGPSLEAATANRIRIGVGIALAIIGLNVASDALALLTVPLPDPRGVTDGRLALMIGLVVLAAATTLLASAALLRAARHAPRSAAASTEPDLLDDLIGLADELSEQVAPIRRPARRGLAAVTGFIEASRLSPRRHRFIFGAVVAAAFGVVFALWHNLVEGPVASIAVFVLFVTMAGGGVLVIYLVTLGPLRLIRRVE